MKTTKKAIMRIARAKDKTVAWQNLTAEMNRDEMDVYVREMVLSLPVGHYRLYARDYGTNIVDSVWSIYGWMPSMLVSERLLRGLQVTHPKNVYVSFTLGLDEIEIK